MGGFITAIAIMVMPIIIIYFILSLQYGLPKKIEVENMIENGINALLKAIVWVVYVVFRLIKFLLLCK